MKKTSPVKGVKPPPDLKEPLPTEVKLLQAQLKKAKLPKEVLQEVIKVAEEELGISIRKKSGTKQS
jgi:hypothetical protein